MFRPASCDICITSRVSPGIVLIACVTGVRFTCILCQEVCMLHLREYREFAEQCRMMAKSARNALQRSQFLRLGRSMGGHRQNPAEVPEAEAQSQRASQRLTTGRAWGHAWPTFSTIDARTLPYTLKLTAGYQPRLWFAAASAAVALQVSTANFPDTPAHRDNKPAPVRNRTTAPLTEHRYRWALRLHVPARRGRKRYTGNNLQALHTTPRQ